MIDIFQLFIDKNATQRNLGVRYDQVSTLTEDKKKLEADIEKLKSELDSLHKKQEFFH